MLFFHLHFDAPDVQDLERRYTSAGFRVKARFGYVGRDHRQFEPEVSWEELQELGVRLRLVELERGAVNIVLMRSRFPELRLGQVGFVVGLDERDAILARAAGLGLHVRDRDVRWLIATGQRFDVELAAARRHRYDERATDELRLESVEIACIDPDGASALVTELLGSAPAARLVFVPGSSSYAELRSAVLAGAGAVSIPRLPLG